MYNLGEVVFSIVGKAMDMRRKIYLVIYCFSTQHDGIILFCFFDTDTDAVLEHLFLDHTLSFSCIVVFKTHTNTSLLFMSMMKTMAQIIPNKSQFRIRWQTRKLQALVFSRKQKINNYRPIKQFYRSSRK